MESFSKLRAYGCVVCGDPVSPCPSPACQPERFGDMAPVVYRSVLLSSSHPQFTRQELQSKLRTGEIERFLTFPFKNRAKSREDRHSYGRRTQFPTLAADDSKSMTRRYQSLQKTSPGFFYDLEDLQRQLFSGHPGRSRPTGQEGKEKSSKTIPRARCETTQTTKVPGTAAQGLFPPILDVWTQNDAMQRSITLRI